MIPMFSETSRRNAVVLLACLLVTDLLLTLAHLGARGFVGFDLLDSVPPAVSLFGDHSSLSEWGIYAKWAFTVCALVMAWRRGRQVAFLCLAAVFAIILADDAGLLHERVGAQFAVWYPGAEPFGVPIRQAGEMLAWLGLAIPVVALLTLGYRMAAGWARLCAGVFILLFCGLIFFAVGIDTIGAVLLAPLDVTARYWPTYAFGTIECVGEMVMASLIACFAAVVLWETQSAGRRAARRVPESRLRAGAMLDAVQRAPASVDRADPLG